MKKSDVDSFEKVKVQLDSLHAEMSVLAKKAPDGATNAFKIKLINVTLDQCNKLLGKKNRPFDDFELFDPDELPSNSDVTFIISQYIECAEKFRTDNIFRYQAFWYWKIDGEASDKPSMRTLMPKKLEQK